MTLDLRDRTTIAENDHYQFVVAHTVPDRWIGGALGDTDDGRMLFVMPEISEHAYLGVRDRDLAIRMTAAIAQAAEQGYGGVARWMIPESLRAMPEDFRCRACGQIAGPDHDCYDPRDFFDE